MLTLKVIWPSKDDRNYSVYSGKNYTVTPLKDNTTQVMITGDIEPIDIRLGTGATVYVMNSSGATVDTIIERRAASRTPSDPAFTYKAGSLLGRVPNDYDYHANHTDDCSIWDNVQQCDFPKPNAICDCK